MIDNALLKKAGAGDMKSFEAIILQYEKYIYNIAYRILYSPEDAKDVSQEVMIKIYKNLHKCTDVNLLKAWISRIATNTCIDELRKRKGKNIVSIDAEIETEEGSMEREQATNEPLPEDSLLQKESMKEIQAALNTLAPDYKTLVVMRDIYGYSYIEMSEYTGTNIGTVKSRLSRARASLRNILVRQTSGTSGTKNK